MKKKGYFYTYVNRAFKIYPDYAFLNDELYLKSVAVKRRFNLSVIDNAVDNMKEKYYFQTHYLIGIGTGSGKNLGNFLDPKAPSTSPAFTSFFNPNFASVSCKLFRTSTNRNAVANRVRNFAIISFYCCV